MTDPRRGLVDTLQDGLLEETFYEDCWLSEVPASQIAPTSEDVRWLEGLLSDDATYVSRSVAERGRWRDLALDVERTVPFLTNRGDPLPVAHRLYLCAEMGKVLLARSPRVLERLASVVVYPGVTKLRRGRNEAGALRFRGPFGTLPLFGAFGDGLQLLLSPLVLREGDSRSRKLRTRVKAAIDETAAWRERILPGAPLAEVDDVNAWIEGARSLCGDVLAHSGKRMRSRPEKEALDQLELPDFVASLHLLLEELGRRRESLHLAARASIHLSWSTQMHCQRSTTHNPMVHELAHLIDFDNGGVDGVPDPADEGASKAALRERWAAQWQQVEQGGSSFLDPYARQDEMELFAVASELFFTDPHAVRDGSPELFEVLRDTYGYVPLPRRPRSSLWLAKTLLFSRMRGVF